MDRWRSWSAQKLPGRAVNRYIRGWVKSSNGRGPIAQVEVHRTACIVTHPPGGEGANAALVVPANERLVGTQFTPEECWSNLHGDPTTGRWDKDFAVYPHQAVDGLVTEFGGPELRRALEELPADCDGVRCAIGSAVMTPSFSELSGMYGALIHAPPPTYRLLQHSDWSEQLQRTYHSAFRMAALSGLTTLAVPLLGAGARGAPMAEAIDVAATATMSWTSDLAEPSALTVRFGLQSSTDAHALCDALDNALQEPPLVDFEVATAPPPARWS